MLRIKGLAKRYRTGDLALKGIDFDVPDGQVMALIGPSGAGKSTVIRCINRLVEPTAGTITLNDIAVTGLGSGDLRRARRRMGMIFQEYALVERLTVMENVLSGRLGYVGFWQSYLRKFPQSDIDEAFRLLARAVRTFLPGARIRKLGLRIVVAPAQPGVGRRRVERPPIFLRVLAVIAFRPAEAEDSLLQDRPRPFQNERAKQRPCSRTPRPARAVLAPAVGA